MRGMELNERVELSMRELDRLKVINQVLERRLPQTAAALQVERSTRQVRRLCVRIKAKGAKSMAHGLRGRPSNHQLAPGLLDRALALVKAHYSDFGPTFAAEKLAERHQVVLSVPTLRAGMMREGLWRARRRKAHHRAWRQRRLCVGELVQVDGSIHAWFEGRGPKCWLIAFVDDATSRILWAEFATAEDTMTLMRLAGVYLRRYGRPLAFYVDKDSIYRTSRGAGLEEELRDEQPMTQFTRAMSELDINIICANSPQAKGRVERGFKTHQDRLVKELRLAGISDIPNASEFLREVYIPRHNARFAQPPAHNADAHRPILRGQLLDRILCLRSPRVIANDFTVRWGPGYLQLLDRQPTGIKPGDKVHVEVRLDKTVRVRIDDEYLNYKTIAKRAYRPYYQARPSGLKQYDDPRTKGVGPKPAPDHPWRKYFDKRPYARRATAPHNDISSPCPTA